MWGTEAGSVVLLGLAFGLLPQESGGHRPALTAPQVSSPFGEFLFHGDKHATHFCVCVWAGGLVCEATSACMGKFTIDVPLRETKDTWKRTLTEQVKQNVACLLGLVSASGGLNAVLQPASNKVF